MTLVEEGLEKVTAVTDNAAVGNVASVTFFARAGRNSIGNYVRVNVEYPD